MGQSTPILAGSLKDNLRLTHAAATDAEMAPIIAYAGFRTCLGYGQVLALMNVAQDY
jgi:ABC-type transport system involved in cytochrome bd biosynthesis fused ATPase/permease subunit